MLHSFPFSMYESASRPAAEAFAVLWLPLYNAHGLKEKTNGFKPNGAPPSEMTCTSCFKKTKSSFTPLLTTPRPPRTL